MIRNREAICNPRCSGALRASDELMRRSETAATIINSPALVSASPIARLKFFCRCRCSSTTAAGARSTNDLFFNLSSTVFSSASTLAISLSSRSRSAALSTPLIVRKISPNEVTAIGSPGSALCCRSNFTSSALSKRASVGISSGDLLCIRAQNKLGLLIRRNLSFRPQIAPGLDRFINRSDKFTLLPKIDIV